MPKKQKEKLSADDVTALQVPEVKPLGVFGNAMDKVFVGTSNKTWANLASLGQGPEYTIVNGRRFYLWEDLEKFAKAEPIKTVGAA